MPRETFINEHVDPKSLDYIPLANTGNEMVQDDAKAVPVMIRNVKVGHVKRKLGIADSKLMKRKRNHSTIKARKPFHRFTKLKCEHCNKTFQRQLSYLLHKATHSFEIDKGNYACNTCHKKYSSSVQLINHKRLCLSPDFICKFCNKKLMSEELLTYHINNSCSAFKVTNYTCPKCDRGFVTQNGFVKHRRKQACEIYKFESENKKKSNPFLVIDVNRLQCELCGKVYANKSSLAKHIRRHKGIKNYKCQICNKCFGDNNQLKAHHRMHSGEKPFLCNKCGKSFGHAGHLNRHIKKHDGTSFVCSQCGKSYMDSNGLTKHMNNHSRNEMNIFK
ncbi:zinc finger protein ZFP2 isoform X2 [Patella vulgata]|nr:zinc finger protein ZFP2 isoform X2 [Patella vulgata]